MTNIETVPEHFPQYPAGTHIATIKEAGQLAKMVGRLANHIGRHPKLSHGSRGKGLATKQTIHITKRKTKFY